MFQLEEECQQEIKKTLEAIESAVNKQGNGLVSFQLFNGQEGSHLIVHSVVVPEMDGGGVLDYILEKGVEMGLQVVDSVEKDDAYFKAQLGDKSILLIPGDQGVNVRFGSNVVAEFLGTPERGEWKNCIVSQQQEEIDVAKWREYIAL